MTFQGNRHLKTLFKETSNVNVEVDTKDSSVFQPNVKAEEDDRTTSAGPDTRSGSPTKETSKVNVEVDTKDASLFQPNVKAEDDDRTTSAGPYTRSGSPTKEDSSKVNVEVDTKDISVFQPNVKAEEDDQTTSAGPDTRSGSPTKEAVSQEPSEPLFELIVEAILSAPKGRIEYRDMHKYIAGQLPNYFGTLDNLDESLKRTLKMNLSNQNLICVPPIIDENSFEDVFWTLHLQYLRTIVFGVDCDLSIKSFEASLTLSKATSPTTDNKSSALPSQSLSVDGYKNITLKKCKIVIERCDRNYEGYKNTTLKKCQIVIKRCDGNYEGYKHTTLKKCKIVIERCDQNNEGRDGFIGFDMDKNSEDWRGWDLASIRRRVTFL